MLLHLSLLLSSREHSVALKISRAEIIKARITLCSMIIAALMLFWIPVDVFFLGKDSMFLVYARVLSAVLLAALILYTVRHARQSGFLLPLFLLFFIPAVFFSYTNFFFSALDIQDMPAFVIIAYLFLPFLIAMLLCFFPLTALECFAFSAFICFITFVAGGIDSSPAVVFKEQKVIFILVIFCGIASIAGISHLLSIKTLLVYSTHDQLTGCLRRDYGLKMLETVFEISQRERKNLSVVFIDLDNFKQVNDRFGHDAGDAVLKETGKNLSRILRRQDMVIRWGGEEFVLVFPGLSAENIDGVFLRLRATALAGRPDSTPQTASCGVAESQEKDVTSIQTLLDLADQRMFQAKEKGKNRIAFKDGKMETFYAPEN
ncbi:MAG: GGDEF domain-containing protein [Micavibrio sp.]|nr:MAG: GGDEF domain-containing protein [Micavibrio sp.]